MSKAVAKKSGAKASKFVGRKKQSRRDLVRSLGSRTGQTRKRTSLYSADEANWLNALVHSAARGASNGA